MRSTEGILHLYYSRLQDRAPIHASMRAIAEICNGDAQLPTDELTENSAPAVANLINTGLEQMGLRIASVLPDLSVPPVDPTSKRSVKRASDTRMAVFGWWEINRFPLIKRKRSRYLLAYGETPVVIMPDWKMRVPKWEVRDPLTAYPAVTNGLTPLVDDVVFTYTRSVAWLRNTYPEYAAAMPVTTRSEDGQITLLEYFDVDERVLVAIGANRKIAMLKQVPGARRAYPSPGATMSAPMLPGIESRTFRLDPDSGDVEFVELDRFAHRMGQCPVTYPTRITLDKLQGHFDQLVGLYFMQAQLMALAIIGVERGVLPETWVLGTQQGSSGEIVQQADARSGKIGRLQDATIQQFRTDPGFQTNPMIDRLEYAIRQSGGIPPELGGASQSNVRTGRRGENILSAAIDFPIQEAQEILAFSIEAECQIAIDLTKAWWGNKRMSYWVNWRGARGKVEYTPNKIFESDEVRVSYARAGSDANQLVIGGGQRLGLKTLSRLSFQKLDGWVEDPEFEHDQITAEGLEDALLASLQQQAAAGALPPTDLARVITLIRSDKMELPEAIAAVQAEAQARQAEAVPPGAPEAEPGIAQPGMGAEQPVETIAGPSGDQQNLVKLLGALRLPQQLGRAERGQSIASGR